MKERLVNTLLDNNYTGEEIAFIMKHIPDEETTSFNHEAKDIWDALNPSFLELKSMFHILSEMPSENITKLAEYTINSMSNRQQVIFMTLLLSKRFEMVSEVIRDLKIKSNFSYSIQGEISTYMQDMPDEDPLVEYMKKYDIAHVLMSNKDMYIPVRSRQAAEELEKVEKPLMAMKMFCDVTGMYMKAVNKNNKVELYAVKFEESVTKTQISAAYD